MSRALDFPAERNRLIFATRKGIGMPIAGLLYWIGVAILLRALPLRSALIASFVLTGPVFPIGAMLTRLAGGDLFAKSPHLTQLGMLLAAVQLFYWPVIVIVFNHAVEWTPLVLALLFGSHFLPYAWVYRSAGYATLAVLTTVVLSVAALVSGGPIVREAPLLAAACYLVAVAMLWVEVRRIPAPASPG
ncbi:MAG: hypothetical protein AB7R55_07115 [Gemmatimonadales bacterium]